MLTYLNKHVSDQFLWNYSYHQWWNFIWNKIYFEKRRRIFQAPMGRWQYSACGPIIMTTTDNWYSPDILQSSPGYPTAPAEFYELAHFTGNTVQIMNIAACAGRLVSIYVHVFVNYTTQDTIQQWELHGSLWYSLGYPLESLAFERYLVRL